MCKTLKSNKVDVDCVDVKKNLYNLNLCVKDITKMHGSKDRAVAFTL